MKNLEVVRFKENYRVTVHRRFAEAIFDTPLSIYEQRILYVALSNIEPPIYKKDINNKDVLNENGEKIITNYLTELPVFEMRLQEFGELIGLKQIDYRHVKKIMRDFKKKGLEIHRLDRLESDIDVRDYRGINILLESEYLHKEGTIRIEFSPKLLPYVANLTGEFITVPLNVITSFTSKYSTKLYLLMQQWRVAKNKEFSIDELKGAMGVPFDTIYQNGIPTKVFKLDLYGNFKNRALEPAIKEINKFSNLNISYEEIKKGKKTTKIKFRISETKSIRIDHRVNIEEDQVENSYTIQEYLAREVFHDCGFGKLVFRNIAKSLENIPHLAENREIEFKIYQGLNELKVYFEKQGNLGEGYLISEIRKMVKVFNDKGKFSFNNGFVRNEVLPDWLINKKSEETKKMRLEYEQNQPFKVIRKDLVEEPSEAKSRPSKELPEVFEDKSAKFEATKQELLKKLADKKTRIHAK